MIRIAVFTLIILHSTFCFALPPGFAYLNDPRIIQSMDYATDHNFIGRKIAGYKQGVCILTTQARDALVAVQDGLDTLQMGYALKVFDCYRPTTAVMDFVQWSHDSNDQKMKQDYYPNIAKTELFKLGYIADRSGHSRGSTVDLTIAQIDPSDNKKHKELEMGTNFDHFGDKSHTESKNVPAIAHRNRQLLKHIMYTHGFRNYPHEWWHYTLENEPFPETYYDFEVK